MRDALEEITKTLAETVVIVGLVVYLFMGSVRTDAGLAGAWHAFRSEEPDPGDD